jgi:hypothetical protein
MLHSTRQHDHMSCCCRKADVASPVATRTPSLVESPRSSSMSDAASARVAPVKGNEGREPSALSLEHPRLSSQGDGAEEVEDEDKPSPLPLSARGVRAPASFRQQEVVLSSALHVPPNTPATDSAMLTAQTQPSVIRNSEEAAPHARALSQFDAAMQHALVTLEAFMERLQHLTLPSGAPQQQQQQQRLDSRFSAAAATAHDTVPRVSQFGAEDKGSQHEVAQYDSHALPASTQFVAFGDDQRTVNLDNTRQSSPQLGAMQPRSMPLFNGAGVSATSSLAEEQAALLRTLHAALRGREDDLHVAHQELDMLRTQAASHRQRYDAAEAAYTQLMDAAVNVRTRYAAANDEISRLRTSLQGSTSEAASLRAQVESLRSELLSERRRAGDTSAALQASHAELCALQAQHAELMRAHRTALASAAAATHDAMTYQAQRQQDDLLGLPYAQQQQQLQWSTYDADMLQQRQAPRVSSFSAEVPPAARQSQMPFPVIHSRDQFGGVSAYVAVPPNAAHKAHPSAARGLQVSFDPFTGGPARAPGGEATRARAAPPVPQRASVRMPLPSLDDRSASGPDLSAMSAAGLEQHIDSLCRERDVLTEELRRAGPTSGRTLAARTHRTAIEARVEQVARELAAARVEQRNKSAQTWTVR